MKTQQVEKPKSSAWRKKSNWDWAERYVELLDGILPDHVSAAALATCRFTVQGPESVGESATNWGHWVRMRMQTFGFVPDGIGTVQKTLHWIATDSKEAADFMLGLFGLSMESVYSAFGKPNTGEKYDVDLCEVVRVCSPDFTLTTNHAAAVAA